MAITKSSESYSAAVGAAVIPSRLDLETTLKLADIPSMKNVAEHLTEGDCERIGSLCKADFGTDLSSRSEWETKTEGAHKLVLQLFEEKTWPWPRASSVKFPILSIAAIQYHARAYPALIVPNDIVRYQTFGADASGEKEQLGKLIAGHMTYQLTEEDEDWEDSTDRTLLIQAIVGCAFKKIYYDPIERKNRSDVVLPRNMVIPYYARSLEESPRLSQIIELSQNDLYERRAAGLFLDVDITARETGADDRLTLTKNKSQGLQPAGEDTSKSMEFVEQHRLLDLDGDGYAEPYAITFHRSSGKVLRIIARFTTSRVEKLENGDVFRIKAIHYFQKFPFIPSPDGGIYDIGLGQLLLPLNKSIDTLVNQLIDAGTLSNLGGGFLGRGVRIKGGPASFQPGEWKPIDSTGDDIQKSVFPLPIREPSNVLYQLLSLLIDYSERLSSATDATVGISPGQNTPAETSRNTLEQGMKVFNGIFKRTYRALKGEFRKLYILNSMFLPDEPTGPFEITAGHYQADPKGVRPAADPNVMSDSQRIGQATQLIQAAQTAPGMYDQRVVHMRYLEALRIPQIEKVMPDPRTLPPPPPDPKQLQEATRAKMADIKAGDVDAKHKLAAAKMMILGEKGKAEIMELQAKAAKEMEEAKATGDRVKIDATYAKIAAAEARHSGIVDAIEILNTVATDAQQLHLEKQNAARESGAGTVQ